MSDNHCNLQERLLPALKILDKLERVAAERSLETTLRERLFATYRLMISLLPRAAYFGPSAQARLEILYQARKLAICAASYALQLSQPEVAVELLEEGRAVFWSHYMRLRTSFDDLPLELARTFKVTSRKLEEKLTSGSKEDQMAEHRRLGEQWEILLSKARSIPGFERFLLPNTFNSLSHAARKGPVVLLLAGEALCQAIVIEQPSSTANQVSLPGVTLRRLEDLKRSLERSNCCARALGSRALKRRDAPLRASGPSDVYAELWKNVMWPVIESLSLKVSVLFQSNTNNWCIKSTF